MDIVGTDADVIIGKGFKGRIACLQFYRTPLLEEHIKYAMDKCYIESPSKLVGKLNILLCSKRRLLS